LGLHNKILLFRHDPDEHPTSFTAMFRVQIYNVIYSSEPQKTKKENFIIKSSSRSALLFLLSKIDYTHFQKSQICFGVVIAILL
jgi:hypothetical protein